MAVLMCLSCAIEEVTGLDLSTEAGHDELAKLVRIPWPRATDKMIECAAYIGALYANPDGGTGGPLHIATDDNNLDDSSLAFCRKNLEEWGDYCDEPENAERVKLISLWILDLLEPLSPAERQVTVELGHRQLAEINGRVFMPATEFPIREDVLDADGNKVGMQWGFKTRTVSNG